VKFALRFYRRLARWRPAHTSRVLAICCLFGLLILSGVYATREYTGLFQSTLTISELGPDDPAVRFADTGVGQLLISSTRSDNCRRLLFDNRTGSYHETNEVFCGHKPGQESPNRLEVVRKSFQR
jgi:hypothetical protein